MHVFRISAVQEANRNDLNVKLNLRGPGVTNQPSVTSGTPSHWAARYTLNDPQGAAHGSRESA